VTAPDGASVDPAVAPGPTWLGESDLARVQRFGAILWGSVVTASGETLAAGTVIAPARVLAGWGRTSDGSCEIVVVRGRYRARVFRVEARWLCAALGW
jgi:hypothetical protein